MRRTTSTLAIMTFVAVALGVASADGKPRDPKKTRSPRPVEIVAPPPDPAPEDELARVERAALAEAPYRLDERDYRRTLRLIAKDHARRVRDGALPARDADATVEQRDRTMSPPAPGSMADVRKKAGEETMAAVGLTQDANRRLVAAEQRERFSAALAAYERAERAWQSLVDADDLAADSYESRYWLADARHWQILLSQSTDRGVAPAAYGRALAALLDVRDDDGDDRFREVSANHIVALARALVAERYQANYLDPRLGFPERSSVSRTGSGRDLKIEVLDVPGRIQRLIATMDEYAARVPPALDPSSNGSLFRFQAAKFLFQYGHWAEAEARYRRIGEDTSDYSDGALHELRSMAAFEAEQTGDRTKLDALVADQEKRRREKPSTDPFEGPLPDCKPMKNGLSPVNSIIASPVFPDAWNCFHRATRLPEGPERTTAFRWAATLYEDALRQAPSRDEAPEPAINGAIAWKYVGEYRRAIALYELFVSHYGDPSVLHRLSVGDENGKREYARRAEYLFSARHGLFAAHVMSFDYPRAAAVAEDLFLSSARSVQRRDGARNALVLYLQLGDEAGAERARRALRAYASSPSDRADVEAIEALSLYQRWDQRASDVGDNHAVKLRAATALERLCRDHARTKGAETLVAGAADALVRLHGPGAGAARWRKLVVDVETHGGGLAQVWQGGRGLAYPAAIGMLVSEGRAAEPPFAKLGTGAPSRADGERASRAVRLYTQVVVRSRQYAVSTPDVAVALRRLAILTDVLGDDAMKRASAGIEGFTYRDGMWRHAAPGLAAPVELAVMPPPSP